MPSPKLIIHPEGLEAQFRLIPKDDELEEGQIEDDDDDDDDDVDEDNNQLSNNDANKTASSAQRKNGQVPTAVPLSDDKHAESLLNDAMLSDPGPQNDKNNDLQGAKSKKHQRLSLFEMQSFLIALLLPEPRLSTPPNWCKVLRCMRASNVGLFLLDNVDLDWIEDKADKFTHAFRFEVGPNWIEKLTNIPLSRRMQNLTTPEEFMTHRGQRFETNLDARPKISKTSLLLSPVQMLVENYPMPFDEDVRTLRSKYRAVDEHSPMFAIDCEMCITDKSELTRISIVDEDLNTVYNELVKPDLAITNYLTRYSGITADMMRNVKTKLSDVQEYIRKNFPSNSIFVGHSLNMDLAAIKIFHPYVIDTSVIYNRSGSRTHKPSLKSLAYEFLGKAIQHAEKLGHDSIEDSLTAMELVKLKIVNGGLFGDAVSYEASQGFKFDSRTGITHLQFDKFIERHDVTKISYRRLDMTPGSRCVYIHDGESPLGNDVKDTIMDLLGKKNTICAILTNLGECYVKI